jgi:hypothetical protein
LKVLTFDEARFGLINWHRRRYCPKGFRPPYIVKRSYEWTYLGYAAIAPTTGESFCLYLPAMDEGCLETFLGELSKAYPENHLLVVLDGVPEPVPLLRASHVREVGTAVDTPQIIHRVPDKRHTLSQRAVNNEAGRQALQVLLAQAVEVSLENRIQGCSTSEGIKPGRRVPEAPYALYQPGSRGEPLILGSVPRWAPALEEAAGTLVHTGRIGPVTLVHLKDVSEVGTVKSCPRRIARLTQAR